MVPQKIWFFGISGFSNNENRENLVYIMFVSGIVWNKSTANASLQDIIIFSGKHLRPSNLLFFSKTCYICI
ncbi:MAG: hypothetical protein R6U46_10675 [Marinilabilia sp.]